MGQINHISLAIIQIPNNYWKLGVLVFHQLSSVCLHNSSVKCVLVLPAVAWAWNVPQRLVCKWIHFVWCNQEVVRTVKGGTCRRNWDIQGPPSKGTPGSHSTFLSPFPYSFWSEGAQFCPSCVPTMMNCHRPKATGPTDHSLNPPTLWTKKSFIFL